MLAYKNPGFLALLGAFATGGLAEYSNAQSTQTLSPGALGTTTANGAVLVSMNYCSIIVMTQCQVSVVTSALSPPPAAQTSGPAAVPSGSPSTGVSAPTSAGASSTKAPITSTKTIESQITAPPTSGKNPAPPVVSTASTAAASGIKAFPGPAWGAVILAVAVLF